MQCAADKTWRLVIIEPPQLNDTPFPRRYPKSAIQGQEPFFAGAPPTILDFLTGEIPQPSFGVGKSEGPFDDPVFSTVGEVGLADEPSLIGGLGCGGRGCGGRGCGGLGWDGRPCDGLPFEITGRPPCEIIADHGSPLELPGGLDIVIDPEMPFGPKIIGLSEKLSSPKNSSIKSWIEIRGPISGNVLGMRSS
jgi:hypothetical protein